MRRCAQRFPQSLVYFTNEAQTGISWDTLFSNEGDLWNFEAALLPHTLAARFQPIPEQFAARERWNTVPWGEDLSLNTS